MRTAASNEEPLLIILPWRKLSWQRGKLLSHDPYVSFVFPLRRAAVAAALLSLNNAGKTATELETEVLRQDKTALPELRKGLAWLHQHLLLAFDLRLKDTSIGWVEPLSTAFSFTDKPLPKDAELLFSRFALLRREASGWILENPLLLCRLHVIDPDLIQLLAAFAVPTSLEAAAKKVNIPRYKLEPFVQWMCSLGFFDLTAIDPEPPALQLWEFHDLYFHSRTRLGRHHQPVGYAPRFEGAIPPAPVVKRYAGKPLLYLPKADFSALKEKEASLSEVMERRKTIRWHGEPLINLTEVGEFLYRVARVKSFEPRADGDTVSERPYPNAGKSYELEFYLLVQACAELPSGCYYYDAVEHGLVLLSAPSAQTQALYESTNYRQKADFNPQIIIFLSARFARNSWKYQSLSYANTLKHVGVLFQSMYLVATSMGLAPSGWSTGNSDLFNAATGTHYYEETSVGEFLLGGPDAHQADTI